MPQVVQLLKVLQNAQPTISHNWQRPLLNEYPVKQDVQVLTELGHVAQDGTLQELHVCPTKEYPEAQPTQTVADVQFAQLLIEHAKHALLDSKNPVLQTAH